MPIYEVEIQRTTTEIHYATVTVEAESKEDAEMLAIKSEDSNWELYDCDNEYIITNIEEINDKLTNQ